MIAKKLMRKRGVMIAVAVIALMTLTAGVAAAKANQVRFSAQGSVVDVGLLLGSSVESDFKLGKHDKIKRVTVTTVGEAVEGSLDAITKCKETGVKKHETGILCPALETLLTPSSVFSVHDSTATLSVKQQEHAYAPDFGILIPVISGKLKGNLSGVLTIVGDTGAGGDVFIGEANLKIKTARGMSHYACLLGLDPTSALPLPLNLVWGEIGDCQDEPGPNTFGLLHPALGYILTTGAPDPTAGPVLVPLELHVTDKGKFEVTGLGSGVVLSGELEVKVDSDPLSGKSGSIKVTKGRAMFPPAP